MASNGKDTCGNFPLAWRLGLFWCSVCVLSSLCSTSALPVEMPNIYTAQITATYFNSTSGLKMRQEVEGQFGTMSQIGTEEGQLVHATTADAMHHGCTPHVNAPALGPWIALIQRGNCKFEQKIVTAALHNASAVVVYNHKDEDLLIAMNHNNYVGLESVFISKVDGDTLADLVDSGVDVTLTISVGFKVVPLNTTSSVTELTEVKSLNLLIISLSFVMLLMIALSCVLVYAVRRNQAKASATMVFTTDAMRSGKNPRSELLHSHRDDNLVRQHASAHANATPEPTDGLGSTSVIVN